MLNTRGGRTYLYILTLIKYHELNVRWSFKGNYPLTESLTVNNIEVDSTVREGRDHYLVSFNVQCNLMCETKQEITYRNYKDLSLPAFQENILSSSELFLQKSKGFNFEASIKLYENIFKDVVNNHAPLVTKIVNSL